MALPENLTATEGRVLVEIAAQDGVLARDLIVRLGVDAGYLSRMLTRFEKQRWLKRSPSPRDKRASLLGLTARGKVLATEVDAAVEQGWGNLPIPLQAALPKADTAPVTFRHLQLGDAGWIIHRHGALIAREMGWDIKFEALAAQIMADFIRRYDPAAERSWVVARDGRILGSLLLVREDAETCRLRLLYIEPEARGSGLARRLMGKAIAFARHAGYRSVRLFTTQNLTTARRIYAQLGFHCVKEEPTSLFGEGLIGEEWELSLDS